jgi:hypothetical protein
MITKHFALVAGIAWASVAVSSAAPANARVATGMQASYVSCATTYSSVSQTYCGTSFNYRQLMKVISSSCATGVCVQQDLGLVCESTYPIGRKTAYLDSTCDYVKFYSLSPCAC